MTSDDSPHVLLLTGNLMGSSRVSGVARGLGMQFRAARTTEQVQAVNGSRLRAVLVDLDMPIDLKELDEALGETGAARIAFGPHVDHDKLQAAADSGWQVLTRGQFDSALPQLAAQWAQAD